ncbi:MAG: helix-turn-helix transcriptional regulator [Clostridia bacterium]|nr:helix-turn-helix transcriptional regulator [Clostridia bacterium]
MPLLYEKRRLDFFYLDALHGARPLACGTHMHQHVEVVYMKKGRSGALVESAPCEIRDDSLFITFPNQLHAYEGRERQEYHLLIVNPSLFPELSGVFGGYVPKSPILEKASDHPELLTLIELIAAESAKPEGDERVREAALRGLGLAFFSALLRVLPLDKQSGTQSDSMRRILEYCAQNYREPLSLEALGEALHMSKYYISHLFSDRYHMSFSDYIGSLRLADACRYLECTDRSVTEISELVGFGSTRTFNRAFQKHYGLSPTDYRNQSAELGEQTGDDPAPVYIPPEPATGFDCGCDDCGGDPFYGCGDCQ